MQQSHSFIAKGAFLLLLSLGHYATATAIDVNNKTSVKVAATQIVSGFYKNFHNSSSTAGDFNQEHGWFWWQSGSGWTAVLDYMIYTQEDTYKKDFLAAYEDNVGPNNDLVPPEQANWEANDDQAYWVFGALTALEYGFDELPCKLQSYTEPGCPNTWLNISMNAADTFIRRWKEDSVTCGGGLKWQYRKQVSGYTYKNSVSNGGFFQTVARLARYTGSDKYCTWADTIYDWSTAIGLVSEDFNVYDGTTDADGKNCSTIQNDEWSYNVASYMHGAANMYAYYKTQKPEDKESLAKWEARAKGFVQSASKTFFGAVDSAPDVMFEQKCERDMKCSADQTVFKSSLARWMGKTAVLVPSLQDSILPLLKATAKAAAGSCVGGTLIQPFNCGETWWTGSYDGLSNFGTQLSALEAVQSVLAVDAPPLLVAH